MVIIHCSPYTAFVKVIHVSIHHPSLCYITSALKCLFAVSHIPVDTYAIHHTVLNNTSRAESTLFCICFCPVSNSALTSKTYKYCIQFYNCDCWWCPPTFNRIRPLPIAAHVINYINITLCKRKHAVRLCCIRHIALLSYSAPLQTCQASWDIHLIYSAVGLSVMSLYN
jgi:hypothetical protein